MAGMETVFRHIKEEGSNIFFICTENRKEIRDFYLSLEDSSGRLYISTEIGWNMQIYDKTVWGYLRLDKHLTGITEV